jgi:DNA modification methylase
MLNTTYPGDCRQLMQVMAATGVRAQTCVTSPPYFGLRDYGHAGQIGLEATPAAYVAQLVEVFRRVRDVLTDDGTLWLNLGDSYLGGGGFAPNAPINARRHKSGDRSAWGKMNPASYAALSAKKSAKPKTAPGLKTKDLIGIPWRVAFALQEDGWYLRSDIIWHKPNPMPESVTDRPTKAHEYLFLFAKQPKYYYDAGAIREDVTQYRGGKVIGRGTQGYSKASAGPNGAPQRSQIGGYGLADDLKRNARTVWTITPKPFKGAHFACFPPDLVRPCILAGSRPGDTVLDPFMGSGTVAQVAREHGRNYIGCELNTEYIKLHALRGLVA